MLDNGLLLESCPPATSTVPSVIRVAVCSSRAVFKLPVTVQVRTVTIRDVDPNILPTAALMLVVPTVSDVPKPLEPAALLMLATDVEEETQVTEVVRFWVELSAKVPTAVNCWSVPCSMVCIAGVTAIETNAAGVTVSVTGAEFTDPNMALMTALPCAALEAKPRVPKALLIVAVLGLSEAQVTWMVRSWVELSV